MPLNDFPPLATTSAIQRVSRLFHRDRAGGRRLGPRLVCHREGESERPPSRWKKRCGQISGHTEDGRTRRAGGRERDEWTERDTQFEVANSSLSSLDYQTFQSGKGVYTPGPL